MLGADWADPILFGAATERRVEAESMIGIVAFVTEYKAFILSPFSTLLASFRHKVLSYLLIT